MTNPMVLIVLVAIIPHSIVAWLATSRSWSGFTAVMISSSDISKSFSSMLPKLGRTRLLTGCPSTPNIVTFPALSSNSNAGLSMGFVRPSASIDCVGTNVKSRMRPHSRASRIPRIYNLCDLSCGNVNMPVTSSHKSWFPCSCISVNNRGTYQVVCKLTQSGSD